MPLRTALPDQEEFQPVGVDFACAKSSEQRRITPYAAKKANAKAFPFAKNAHKGSQGASSIAKIQAHH